jgi:hypothetical protein
VLPLQREVRTTRIEVTMPALEMGLHIRGDLGFIPLRSDSWHRGVKRIFQGTVAVFNDSPETARTTPDILEQSRPPEPFLMRSPSGRADYAAPVLHLPTRRQATGTLGNRVITTAHSLPAAVRKARTALDSIPARGGGQRNAFRAPGEASPPRRHISRAPSRSPAAEQPLPQDRFITSSDTDLPDVRPALPPPDRSPVVREIWGEFHR